MIWDVESQGQPRHVVAFGLAGYIIFLFSPFLSDFSVFKERKN